MRFSLTFLLTLLALLTLAAACQKGSSSPNPAEPGTPQIVADVSEPSREGAAFTTCGDLEFEIRAIDDSFTIENNTELKWFVRKTHGSVPDTSWFASAHENDPELWVDPPSRDNMDFGDADAFGRLQASGGHARNATRSVLEDEVLFSRKLDSDPVEFCFVPITIAANAYPTSPALGTFGFDHNGGDINSGDRVKVTWPTTTPPDTDNDTSEVTVILSFDLNGDNDLLDAGDYVSDPIAWSAGTHTTPVGKVAFGASVKVTAVSHDNAGASNTPVNRTYDVCSLSAPTINSATTKFNSTTNRSSSNPEFGALTFSWTSVGDADRYRIRKLQWNSGASISALTSWTNLAETISTSYTATFTASEVKSSRFLFAVEPLCSVGIDAGPVSNYLMIASCNFEDSSTNLTSILTPDSPVPNGWTANSRYPDSDFNAIYWQHSGINGGVSINTKPSSAALSKNDGWVVFNTPAITDGSNGLFSHLRGSPVSYLEASIKAQGAFGTNGGLCVAAATGRPTDGGSTASGVTYRWADFIAGDLDYNDNASADLDNRFPGLTNKPPSGSWCYFASGGGPNIFFNKWDLSSHLSTSHPHASFIEASTGNSNALVLIDNVTWLVF